jgi:hypothetical protein
VWASLRVFLDGEKESGRDQTVTLFRESFEKPPTDGRLMGAKNKLPRKEKIKNSDGYSMGAQRALNGLLLGGCNDE